LPPGRADFEFVRDTGLLQKLSKEGRLVEAETLAEGSAQVDDGEPSYILSHPRLDFVSYPYEWSFPALRDAALLQLDIHLAALDAGITLSDASAYNILFDGPKPVFIDYLSFRRYRDGEFWDGHRQFCEQFLNPLLLTAFTGIPFQSWYRGSLEGIPANHLARILPLRRRLSWRVLSHVLLQAAFQKPKALEDAAKVSRMNLPLAGFKGMLSSLRAWVASLEPSRRRPAVWTDYAADNTYAAADAETKRAFVRQFSSRVRPRILVDVGCNTGDYSKAALEAGAGYAIGWESDHGALDAAYLRARSEALRFLPIHVDAVNPSPAQGWAGRERRPLTERTAADAVLALALVHHMSIARNVPLPDVVDWIIDLAPAGVIEFVPKNDPMVRRLLRLREDIFADYAEDTFLERVRQRGEVVDSVRLPGSGRLLLWFQRR
jgi:ribosomal protein L11 methylase PrmA